jgi:hypothetical protein
MEERAHRVARIMGRGRSDQAPVYLELGLVTLIGVVVAVVVGLAFLAMWLA